DSSWAAGLSAAALQSASPGRGDLHARSNERRAPRDWGGTRNLAVRIGLPQREFSRSARDIRGIAPGNRRGAARAQTGAQRTALSFRQCADRNPSQAETE